MYEDTLKHVNLFSSLNKKELQALAKSCQERKYSAGSTLFSQGDTGVGLSNREPGNRSLPGSLFVLM